MFTRLSRENAAEGKLILDAAFITDYLPYAPENHVKVYICGLAAAQGLSGATDISRLAAACGADEESVLSAFSYWEENGLGCVHRADTTYVEYLPVIPAAKQVRKYSKEKFRGFNDQLHAILPDRNFLPAEYNEYYYCMDTLHIEVEAMLIIIGYCIRIKGEKIHSAYILKVARNLADEGCTTYAAVSEKINEYDFMYSEVTAVLKALKLKRRYEPEDSRLYTKWIRTYGFDSPTVMHVASCVKRGGMERLDSLLTKYSEMRLMGSAAIDEYEARRKQQYDTMGGIVRNLGLSYGSLDSLVETYLKKWQALGYTDETLLTIASYCLSANTRTLEGMNGMVTGFHRKGLVSASDITEYVACGKKVAEILQSAGVPCSLDAGERTLFEKWKHSWHMSDELIEKAAASAVGKERPVLYINKVLGDWFDGGVKTANDADCFKPAAKAAPAKTYSADELNAMFEELNDDKL